MFIAIFGSLYLVSFSYCIYKVVDMDIDIQMLLENKTEMNNYIYDLLNDIST